MNRALAVGCLWGIACAAPGVPRPPIEPEPDAAGAADPPRPAAPDAAAIPPPDVAPASLEPDAAVDPDAPPMTPAGPVAHRFLKGFSGGGSVAIVGRDGTIEWEMPVAEHEANDAWLLPGGNVLFGFKTGCREVNPAKQVLWEFRAAGGAETHSCQPLPDGNILVGESRADGTTVVQEMNRAKEILRMFTVQQGGGTHSQLRQLRKTPEGTYLLSQQRGGGKAREVDASGKVLRTFPCGQFVAIRLPDGNTLIACGDDHRVIEVDRQDQVVWEVKENDIPGNRLGFVAGLQRLANGNTVICNWSGHSGLDDQPQVFELTRDKRLVWELKDRRLDKISTIEILDPEAAVGGVMLR
jgi:Mal s 1 allergenic protein-like